MIEPLVQLILSEVDLARRLLLQHHDDGTGRCAGCRTTDRPPPLHPCIIRTHAGEAARTRPSPFKDDLLRGR